MISTTSTSSSHPLRQTSFPPENAGAMVGTPRYSRSPSVDSLVSSSAAGGPGPKKKRPQKSKGKLADDESVAGGKAKSAVSGNSGRGKRKASVASVEEDEEEGGEDMAVEMVARTQEEKQKEHEHRAMLVGAFDPDQFERYAAWRSSKLPDSVVRRVRLSMPQIQPDLGMIY